MEKSNRVQIRLSDEIYDIVESESKRFGISISEYIRLCVINSININELEKKFNTLNKKMNIVLSYSFNSNNMLNFLSYNLELDKQIKNPMTTKEFTSSILIKSQSEYKNETSKMRNE